MPLRLFLRDSPQRSIALASETHVLIFRHSPSSVSAKQSSSLSVNESAIPRCIVQFSPWEGQSMEGYRALSSSQVQGTLGLVTLNNEVFLCIVNGSNKVATVRPGETIQQILSVEFHCLTGNEYDHLLNDHVNPYPTDDLDADGHDYGTHKESFLEHPCMALKKLLSGGSFYYSADFDLTKRLQDRPTEASTVSIDSLDGGFLWNTHMIQPLVDFRSRLSQREKDALDRSRILTSAIRGFAKTVTVPASSSPARARAAGMPSNMTLISRLSCRRAGTRFNARGIDDDGNVANFVETETIFATDTLCFSYVQCRGSIPMFWEQAAGLPGQQKIQITRSIEATQPAFDKHFATLFENYGDVFVVNLLSEEKSSELQLTRQYQHHIENSPLYNRSEKSNHRHLDAINYDFHAETRGPSGYEAAGGIRRFIERSAFSFEYFLSEDTAETINKNGATHTVLGQNDVLKQSGTFRTNCLDCLDRTNLVQTILSQTTFENFLSQQGENRPTSDFWARHGYLWADNGDALSKIYAGTGALKSSFTRSGKMSFAGALADVRKSAQRLYINNFEDKGRQNTIDMLLGRLIGQVPVHLYDPINDYVIAEVNKRSAEFNTTANIRIWVGTFNLNGKTEGIGKDLSPWLCPAVSEADQAPEIVAVAFQEIVELDVQQIMSTNPHRRQAWEAAVRATLNANSQKYRGEDYVLLRGGQLVGASLSIFVRASALPFIKNVEGSVIKTGMSGMAGNKGAVAIRMEYADTSICLVTAHLAAGFGNYDERNQDYRTISNGLRFQHNRSIEDHNTVIWFGDFNYRIGMENDSVRKLIRQGNLGRLYENDQLNLQMVHGKCFPHYSEKAPTFLPTYKFNLGTDDYDTSEKARIPAWCDRILTRGDNLQQLHYDSAPLRFSDHRPVWGLFKCTVSVVDQARRDKISAELYAKRRAVVGRHTAGQGAESDDDSLYGYDSVEPGLPPASSDKKKWWLDSGMPARSTVQAPSGSNMVLNPARPPNPFIPTNEPDWVRVEKPSSSSQPTSTLPSRDPSAAPARKLPPPYRDNDPPSSKPPSSSHDGTYDDSSAARVRMKQTLRKPVAPAKPTKPPTLRSDPSSPDPSALPQLVSPLEPRRVNTAGSADRFDPPLLPARQQSNLSMRLAQQSPADVKPAPSLPPRKVVQSQQQQQRQMGLMDDDGDGVEQDGLKGWAPLKPS